MQVNTRHTSNQQVRDLLHAIAAQPETELCVALLLDAAMHIDGVLDAGFRSSEQDGSASVNGNYSVEGAGALYPLRSGEQPLGALWLTLERGYQLSREDEGVIAAVVDGLTIVMLRDQARRASAQTEQLMRSVLGSLNDPLLVFDNDWRLMLLNPAAQAAFNLSADSNVGKPLAEVVQAESLIAFAEGRQSLNDWANGERIFVPQVQRIFDHDGAPLGAILSLRDITRYNKLNRSQNEFLRIVSHDVRSPLTSISGFAAMLGTAGELNEKQNLFVDKILSGVTQITTLVDNIQDAGRYDPETGFYEMSRTPCDLREMVTRIVNNHLLPAEKQELTIAYAVADDVPIINADPTMLDRAITNLVDNAIKYTPNGGKIDVLVSVRSKDVVISVRDNGFGISPENQKRLFQRHVRLARQEHKRVKGTGLGLFIVRSVAQRHGGDAWVESVENVGSTFSFNIPLSGVTLAVPDQRAN